MIINIKCLHYPVMGVLVMTVPDQVEEHACVFVS